MRCRFIKGKQRELLLLARSSLGLPWRDLSKKLGTNYTSLREWRDEKWCMQLSAYQKLIAICSECKSFEPFLIELREDNWGRKLGGIRTRERNHGFLNPKYLEQSSTWKSRGGQIGTRNWHMRMRAEEPEEYRKMQYARIKHSLKYKYAYQSQKYRNLLELDVAKLLTKIGLSFEYEQFVHCDDQFFFPDFVIGKTVIECTFWYNSEQKAKELAVKVDCYRKIGFELVLIVTTERFVETYSRLLATSNVMVITCDKLSGLLGREFGRVKSAEKGSFSKLSTDRAPAS